MKLPGDNRIPAIIQAINPASLQHEKSVLHDVHLDHFPPPPPASAAPG